MLAAKETTPFRNFFFAILRPLLSKKYNIPFLKNQAFRKFQTRAFLT